MNAKLGRATCFAAFGVALATGFGCAITEYGIITDNDQMFGHKADGTNPIISTRGKAHILQSSQVAVDWPDGSDELLWFVDQKADGTAVLTTYNNFSSGDEPTFHDDLYCDTRRQGCSVFTAPDRNDADLFDGTWNQGCSGSRSLLILLASHGRYGECGRLGRNSRLSLEERSELFNSAVFAVRMGREGLLWDWNASRLNVVLHGPQNRDFDVPIRGSGHVWASAEDNLAVLDLRNPLLHTSLAWYAEFLDRDAGRLTVAEVTYNGITLEFPIAGRHPVIDGDHVRALRERAY